MKGKVDMKKIFFCLLLNCFLAFTGKILVGMEQQKEYKITLESSLSYWTNACFKICPDYPNQQPFTPLSSETFKTVLDDYIKLEKKNFESNKSSFWKAKSQLNGTPFPHMIKKVVDNAEIFVAGDHHGCIHSMLRNLWRLVAGGYLDNNFKIKNKNFFMVFLGDYINRGKYGAEVIYTLCRLKLANPDKVFVLRGNHETNSWIMSNSTYYNSDLFPKYEQTIAEEIYKKSQEWFTFLPDVLLIGNTKKEFIHFSHGGFVIEGLEVCLQIYVDVYKKAEWNNIESETEKYKLHDYSKFINSNEIYCEINDSNSSSWMDFFCKSSGMFKKSLIYVDEKSGRVCCQLETFEEMNKNFFPSIKAFIRGHQHSDFGLKTFIKNDVFEGNSQDWKLSNLSNAIAFNTQDHNVFTFSNASSKLNLYHDHFGLIKINEKYENWKLYPVEEPYPKNGLKKQAYVSIDLYDQSNDDTERHALQSTILTTKNHESSKHAGVSENLVKIAQNGSEASWNPYILKEDSDKNKLLNRIEKLEKEKKEKEELSNKDLENKTYLSGLLSKIGWENVESDLKNYVYINDKVACLNKTESLKNINEDNFVYKVTYNQQDYFFSTAGNFATPINSKILNSENKKQFYHLYLNIDPKWNHFFKILKEIINDFKKVDFSYEIFIAPFSSSASYLEEGTSAHVMIKIFSPNEKKVGTAISICREVLSNLYTHYYKNDGDYKILIIEQDKETKKLIIKYPSFKGHPLKFKEPLNDTFYLDFQGNLNNPDGFIQNVQAISKIETLSGWTDACFRTCKEMSDPSNKIPLTFEILKGALSEYIELEKEKFLTENHSLWEVGTQLNSNPFPHMIKKIVNDAEVFVVGDHHGNIHSMLRNLWRLVAGGYLDNNFKIKKNNFYIVFLGDYIDRGKYGAEVIYTICRLKLANPDNVFVLRGNHEEKSVAEVFGYKEELAKKYTNDADTLWDESLKWFEYLPDVLLMGNQKKGFIHFSHGGFIIDNDSTTSMENQSLNNEINYTNINVKYTTIARNGKFIYPYKKYDYDKILTDDKKYYVIKDPWNCRWGDFINEQSNNIYLIKYTEKETGDVFLDGRPQCSVSLVESLYFNKGLIKGFIGGHQHKVSGCKIFPKNEGRSSSSSSNFVKNNNSEYDNTAVTAIIENKYKPKPWTDFNFFKKNKLILNNEQCYNVLILSNIINFDYDFGGFLTMNEKCGKWGFYAIEEPVEKNLEGGYTHIKKNSSQKGILTSEKQFYGLQPSVSQDLIDIAREKNKPYWSPLTDQIQIEQKGLGDRLKSMVEKLLMTLSLIVQKLKLKQSN
jgi:predicted MPP superfamily phosphohydrolase